MRETNDRKRTALSRAFVCFVFVFFFRSFSSAICLVDAGPDDDASTGLIEEDEASDFEGAEKALDQRFSAEKVERARTSVSSKKKNEMSGDDGNRERVREGTFKCTFEDFENDLRKLKEDLVDADAGARTFRKFEGVLGVFAGCEWTIELDGLRLNEWDERILTNVRCEKTTASTTTNDVENDDDDDDLFVPQAYQYLARITKVSAKVEKPRTIRTMNFLKNSLTVLEDLNASPGDIEQYPKKFLTATGQLEIQIDIKAWREVKDAPDAVPVRAVLHVAPKKAWSLRAVRRFMKPEDWKRDESGGAHSNAGEKSAVAWILPTDSRAVASLHFHEAILNRENKQQDEQQANHNHNNNKKKRIDIETLVLKGKVPSYSFQKLGPLGTVSERKTRRLRNMRLREKQNLNVDANVDDDSWLDDDLEDATRKSKTFFEELDIEDLYQQTTPSSSNNVGERGAWSHHLQMTSVVASDLSEHRGNETGIVSQKISINIDEEMPDCVDAPVTGDLGPLLASFAPDSMRAAHRVTVHGCRADQGGIALVAYSSTADRTHDLWLRVVLQHQENSELDVIVAGEATVPPLEESWSAPMIMRILPWETSKRSGFVKVSKKSFGSSRVSRKLALTLQARQLRPRRVALRLPLDQYGDPDIRKAAKAAAERFGTSSGSFEIPQAERPCALAWVEVNPWDNAAKLLGAAAGLASSSSGKIVRPTDIALAVDGVLLPHDWHPDATMLYAAALLGISTSSSSSNDRNNLNATAAWRWGLSDGDACTVLPNLKRNEENLTEDGKCEKLYAKIRDAANLKEREKLENSNDRLRCDVSQVRAYLIKAYENGSKLSISVQNLPSVDDLVVALVEARDGGAESFYFTPQKDVPRSSSNNKDSSGGNNGNNRKSSSRGNNRNPPPFVQYLNEGYSQQEAAFMLNQFVNANFIPSSSETAAELALIVSATAYVLLVIYLCAGAFRVYNKTSSKVVHKSNKGPVLNNHNHHHGVSPQLKVCLRHIAMAPVLAGWMMAKEPTIFLYALLKPSLSFVLGTMLLFAEEIMRSIRVFVKQSKARMVFSSKSISKNARKGGSNGSNNIQQSEKNDSDSKHHAQQQQNDGSEHASKKGNCKNKGINGNFAPPTSNNKVQSLLNDESSKNNSPTAIEASPETPRIVTEWEAEEEERRQQEEEEEMRRHAAARMSEKRLLDEAIEREREEARLEREEKEEKARIVKEAKKLGKQQKNAVVANGKKSNSNSPMTSPRTTSDAPPGFDVHVSPRPGFTIPPPVPPGLPPTLSPTKKRDAKPLPPPLPKSPPPLNQPMKRTNSLPTTNNNATNGTMLLTPAMIQQGAHNNNNGTTTTTLPPKRRFQFGNDAIVQNPIGSLNVLQQQQPLPPPMPPGRPPAETEQDNLVMSMITGLSDDDEALTSADEFIVHSPRSAHRNNDASRADTTTSTGFGVGLFGGWSGFF